MKSRPANEGSVACNVAKTFALGIPFWSLILFFCPALIFQAELRLGIQHPANYGLKLVSVVAFCLSGALGISSGIALAVYGKGTPLPLDCTRCMVVVGPYGYVRNPMAIGIIMQGVAVGGYLASPVTVLYSLCGVALWNRFARRWEERDLEERFGEEFRRYRSAARCWIPNFRRYRP